MDRAAAVDLHTHLFAPSFGALNLWGIDELLTYHYLVAETLRAEPQITPEAFYARSKREQADLVWDSLFVRRSPLSEATSGVVDVLEAFGLRSQASDLREARDYFAGKTPDGHLDDVLRLAGVASLTMTNDPLDPAERALWDSGAEPDPRFHAALRIDPVLNAWPETAPRLEDEGYRVGQGWHELRRFLDRWIERMKPRYMAVSLPDTFAYPEESHRAAALREAVLPTCREHGLPFAMMIGVRRAVNPRLLSAGDGMGVADLSSLERLAGEFPDNRFLVTTLARENAHHLCVVARKFSNVLPFGCWWFMNNPSLVEETTLMRLEMLGPTFVPQHSDARILDQLVYKWRHSRRSIAAALTARYEAIGTADEARIERDAALLMNGIASDWLGLGS
jgi:hypothetical protein